MEVRKVIFILITILISAGCDSQESFHYVKKGEGKPTVIFESGLGDNSNTWSLIQEIVSKTTTTISYDRLGLGFSSSTKNPRTIENLVLELNQFLTTNNIEEPYILVGHSIGGLIIRKYQHDYPEKIAGLILVDPTDEFFHERSYAIIGKQASDSIKDMLNYHYSGAPPSVQSEYTEVDNTCKKMQEIAPPTTLPVTFLVSYQPSDFLNEVNLKIRKELVVEWSVKASQTKVISTIKSGHYIHQNEPFLVIDAITDMIDDLKNSSSK